MVVDVAYIVVFRLVHLQIQQQSIYRRAFRHNEAGRRFGEALCRQFPGWVVARWAGLRREATTKQTGWGTEGVTKH